MKRVFFVVFLFFLEIFLFLNISICLAEGFILINKADRILELYENNKLIVSYRIGLGLNSLLPKQKKGDFLTPEGVYKILGIKKSKRYGYFLALNYPNLNDLSLAYFKGIFNKRTFSYLVKLVRKNKIVITPLGNGIGIHGGGAYRLEKRGHKFYRNYNWTKGCIALNNRDLLRLIKRIRIGERVIIINPKKSLFEIVKKLARPVRVKPFDFWEGELYLRLKRFFFVFQVKEFYNGIRHLCIKTLYEGILVEKDETNGMGMFEDLKKEEEFKRILLKNLEYISFPDKKLIY